MLTVMEMKTAKGTKLVKSVNLSDRLTISLF